MIKSKPRPIEKLDSTTIDMIAGGEVIERPSSVVKELLENAADAGADRVSVHVGDGGRAKILVKDNGSGMDRTNALRAVERYTTSKIGRVSDLESLTTLGFRGEALASIAAVSQFELRTSDGAQATSVTLKKGAPFAKPCAHPKGTSVVADVLFHNVPARKKFLRARHTETQSIVEVFLRHAAAHPQSAFELCSDDKMLKTVPAHSDVVERAHAIFSKKATTAAITSRSERSPRAELVPVSIEGAGFRLTGALSTPPFSRRSFRALYVSVNQRPIHDRVVLRAIRSAYDGILGDREQPYGVLNIEVDQSTIDVNIHPRKLEVRFSNPTEFLFGISSALRRRVQGDDRVIVGSSGQMWRPDASRPTASGSATANDGVRTFERGSRSRVDDAPARASQSTRDEVRARVTPYGRAPLITELAADFFQISEGHHLEVVDGRSLTAAAIEKALLTRADAQEKYASEHSELETLVFPVRVEHFSRNAQRHLLPFSLEYTMLDDTTLIVRAVPALIREQLDAGDLAELLTQIGRGCDPLACLMDMPLKNIAAVVSRAPGTELSAHRVLEADLKAMRDKRNQQRPVHAPPGGYVVDSYKKRDERA